MYLLRTFYFQIFALSISFQHFIRLVIIISTSVDHSRYPELAANPVTIQWQVACSGVTVPHPYVSVIRVIRALVLQFLGTLH